MNQENIAELIKKIRKDNNLTQKQLADKYNLTYQAVSKWERGINLPDIPLIKQISKDFNISIDDFLDGQYKKKKNNYLYIGIIVLLIILLGIFIISINSMNLGNFNFKILSSKCDNFTISGNIAYNKLKSSIYINNINYCGEDRNAKYSEIECILYEADSNITKMISVNTYNDKKEITLEEFLKTVTITVDDYKKVCREYSENSLFLMVNAKDADDVITTYKIPLSIREDCN